MSGLFYAAPEPPRGIIAIAGPDRTKFLQGLVSNDIRQVDSDRGVWTAFLTPQGKYLHDFFVTCSNELLLLDCEGERSDELRRRLMCFRLRAKVELEDLTQSYEVWLAWGERAADAFGLKAPGDSMPVADGIALFDPRVGMLGVRLLVPRGVGEVLLAEKKFSPVAFAQWDRLRLGLGVPDGSRDLMLEKSILLENGFDELHGIAWDKGCYLGQELTARTKYRGLVKKRLVPALLEGPAPPFGTVVTGPDGAEAGEIRSSRDTLALALLRLDAILDRAPLKSGGTVLHPRKPDWLKL